MDLYYESEWYKYTFKGGFMSVDKKVEKCDSHIKAGDVCKCGGRIYLSEVLAPNGERKKKLKCSLCDFVCCENDKPKP